MREEAKVIGQHEGEDVTVWIEYGRLMADWGPVRTEFPAVPDENLMPASMPVEVKRIVAGHIVAEWGGWIGHQVTSQGMARVHMA